MALLVDKNTLRACDVLQIWPIWCFASKFSYSCTYRMLYHTARNPVWR